MHFQSESLISIFLSLGTALLISFAATPIVKTFAQKVGAMDVPGEARRVHDHPIPRMGGLAIFIGFLLSVVLFADISKQVRGILLGAIIIVTIGAIDDIVSLNAWVKLAGQIAAAVVAVLHGVIIEVLMNPNIFSQSEHLILGIFSIPITIIWIVGVTNSVNLIDGLDGLAVGVSAIASVTMLVVAMVASEGNTAVILAALAGACIGFMPYNLNPAKIFMGDTGALLLGYVLSTVSVMGMIKFYAVVTFIVPVLALAIPVCDTLFAIIRRVIRGQSPFTPDRGHFHHRLLDMGYSQKQAVAILYAISAILGVGAVILATTGEVKVLFFIFAVVAAAIVWIWIFRGRKKTDSHKDTPENDNNEKD